MATTKWLMALGLTLGLICGTGPARSDEAKARKNEAADPMGATFERLKSLAGDWIAAEANLPAAKGKVLSRFRLTGGGSAVAETIMPDSEIEMLSVYHRNGTELLMTHYCCAGNQPRLRAKLGATKDEIVFELVGGTNFDPAKDPHIHGGRIRPIDADHLHTEWDFYVHGKLAHTHTFDLVRRK